jgi:hypothetical protein
MHRLLVSVLAALALPALAAPGDVPTDEAGFTAYVAQRLRKAVGDAPVSVREPLTLSVGPLQANLDRVFRFCRSGAEGCAAEVDRYVAVVAATLAERSTSAPRVEKASLRVVLREAGAVKVAQGTFGPGSPALQRRPFAGSLVELVVVDTPQTVRYVDERALAELKITRDELFALARGNTGAGLRPLGEVARPVQHGQLGTITGSVYEVSRIALHDEWAPLARAQGGTLLVALPATDLVLYASERTPLAVDALRTIARQILGDASHPLSDMVLEWTPEGWVVVP